MDGVNISIKAIGDLAQRIVLPEDFGKNGFFSTALLLQIIKKIEGRPFPGNEMFSKNEVFERS